MSIRGAASEVDVAVDVLVRCRFTLRMFEHVLCQIVRNGLNMPPCLDIAGKQIQERTDRRIFMLGVGTTDDDLSVLVEFECHLGTDIDPPAPDGPSWAG